MTSEQLHHPDMFDFVTTKIDMFLLVIEVYPKCCIDELHFWKCIFAICVEDWTDIFHNMFSSITDD